MSIEAHTNDTSKEDQKKRHLTQLASLKKKVNKGRLRKRFLITVKTSYSLDSSDLYSTLLDGDLFISLPIGALKRASEFNKYKNISRIVINKKSKFVELFISSHTPSSINNDHFIRLLNSMSDQNCHMLATLLTEYQDRCNKYRNALQPSKQLPLFQSVENYRFGLQQELDLYISSLVGEPLIIFRYYFNPFDKFMHVSSFQYNEQFLQIMGSNEKDFIDLVKRVGFVNHLHPNSFIPFMVQALKNQLGKDIDACLRNIDLLTFDDIIVPFEMKSTSLSGKPNEDGYYETYFIFRIHVKPHILSHIQYLRYQRSLISTLPSTDLIKEEAC